MANKRDLKRNIKCVTGELFVECVAASLYGEKTDPGQTDGILASILMTNSDFIKRVSHPEPGMKTKAYYKKLILDFNKQADELIDQINALA